MAHQSLFSSLHIAGELLEVRMDDVDIFLLSSGKKAIGTRGLNGCSCVVIMGSTAIVLAHISPFPGHITEPHPARDLNRESYEHHKMALTTVTDLVRQHQSHFPPSTTVWGVFGWSQDEGHLMSVKDHVETHLKDTLDYKMKPAFYEQMNVYAIAPPKGELVGLVRNNVAELYLERGKLWPVHQQQSAPGHALPPGGAPAGTRWDGQYYVSIQNPAYMWTNNAEALRPSSAFASTQSPPAESHWDGQCYVSSRNPAYV